MFGLQPPRHISTLPFTFIQQRPVDVCFTAETHRDRGHSNSAAMGQERLSLVARAFTITKGGRKHTRARPNATDPPLKA
jgi:hypothetical protein